MGPAGLFPRLAGPFSEGGIMPEKASATTTSDKVSLETAKAQIDSLLKHYDLEPDDIAIDQGPEAMQTIMNGLVKSVQHGRLEINTEGKFQVIQTLVNVSEDATITEVEYREVSGASALSMDQKKGENAKRLAFLTNLTRIPEKELKKLKGVDWGTMRRLADLFSVG